ncbi:hypothetical protein D0Z00_004354 [Geotrichum galactomycetum]|uniref:Uncharacterized protein n=1 Tax=Geotrichum galactomycetum TaxID=27317 RepID=A0ACB6UYU1_9ASCO|nr:hypothetical protein D0Z00_004354 [Geotrichum candidum]
MTQQQPSDSPIKTIDQLITYINKFHTFTLYDLLIDHAGVNIDPTEASSRVRLLAIQSDRLILEYESAMFNLPVKARIPVNPPFPSVADADTAAVRTQILDDLAREAAFDRGFVTTAPVTSYLLPTSFLELGIIVGTFLNVPPLRDYVFSHFLPSAIANSTVIRAIEYYPWLLFVSVMTIHATELVVLMRPLAHRARVAPEVTWRWYFSTLAEGYPAIRRLKSLLK